MKKVYILEGKHYSHDESGSWTVKVFKSLREAKKECKRLNTLLRDNYAHTCQLFDDCIEYEKYDNIRTKIEMIMKKEDPNFVIDYGGSEYRVVEKDFVG